MKLASIFTDHIVIQANMPIRIFGEGSGKATVEFLGKTKSCEFTGDKWCITLDEEQYGGPYDMKITLNGEQKIIEDIYIGEVWLAAGQSNMELVLYKTEYGLEEAENSYNEKIRFFTVPRRTEKDTPLCGWHSDKVSGEDMPWQICCEESSAHFSAIGYYAAKELCEKLNVAVGIISVNWGGVPIETFISRECFKNSAEFYDVYNSYQNMMKELDFDEYMKEYNERVKAWESWYDGYRSDEIDVIRNKGVRACIGAVKTPGMVMSYGPYCVNTIGCIYESMIKRIAPFSVKGMLWYQGESNKSEKYLEKYLLLIKCMRETFENENMQFYAVELASFSEYWGEDEQTRDDRYVSGHNWAFTREQQQRATEIEKNNYLVTSMQLGDLYDIHPIQKKHLTHRIVLKVLKYSYGFNIFADEPRFSSAELKGERVYVKLKNAEGLYSANLKGVKMFVSDDDKILKRANIEIENDELIISCDKVKKISEIRYGFDFYYSGCHIYNQAGLPLAPFRAKL